ncbi:hypothetical protein D9M70_541480 [compost metagenome]
MPDKREIDRNEKPDRDVGDVLLDGSKVPRGEPSHDKARDKRCENDVHIQQARHSDEDQAQQHGITGERRLAELADDPPAERPYDWRCEK